MNDAVDQLLVARQSLDQGFSRGLAFSTALHAALVGVPLFASFVLPHEPPIKIVDGFAVSLPRGGGGAMVMQSGPPAGSQIPPPAAQPPKILKPPTPEAPRRGLPELDAKKGRKSKPEKAPPWSGAASGAAGATGTGASQTPGLSLFGPPGPGVPDGVDSGGDWYLAGVQQRIFAIWAQQIKTGFKDSIAVVFTIRADGAVEDVKIAQPSGVTLLDLAARRAVESAAPFGPLPKNYGTNQLTIQAIFKPTS